MIKSTAKLSIARVALSDIIVTENQVRYPDRAMQYVTLLQDNPVDYAGFVSLKPTPDGRFELLDGHHRFVASILTGRRDLLAVVIDEA